MNWYKKILESDNKNSIIPNMKKELIINRGIQGSGKSTLARQLAGETGQIFSADDYHIDPETEQYNWKPENVAKAHIWNYERMKKAIEQGVSPVILDNINVTMWEMRQAKPLIEFAKSKGYDIRIEETKTPWRFDAEELYKKNTHNVPLETIQKKIRQWVPNVTVDDILKEKEV